MNVSQIESVKIKSKEVRKRPKARSIWNTKKRRKKPVMGRKMTEVFTTSHSDQYQNSDNSYEVTSGIENDPLYISPAEEIEHSKSFSHLSKDSQVEVGTKKKPDTIVKEEKTEDNIFLSTYFLITKIPQAECVYTCKECARTFVSSPAATNHVLESHGAGESDRLRQKKDNAAMLLNGETEYKCQECGHVFSRQSQLVTHTKKHIRADSSSDEKFTPFNRRKSTKRKSKTKSPKSCNKPTLFVNFHDQVNDVITRHSLLSSDSEEL